MLWNFLKIERMQELNLKNYSWGVCVLDYVPIALQELLTLTHK